MSGRDAPGAEEKPKGFFDRLKTAKGAAAIVVGLFLAGGGSVLYANSALSSVIDKKLEAHSKQPHAEAGECCSDAKENLGDHEKRIVVLEAHEQRNQEWRGEVNKHVTWQTQTLLKIAEKVGARPAEPPDDLQ